MNYYIKTMWGPGADCYPKKDKGGVISFSIDYPKQSEKFKECDGFFLYETGHKEDGRIGVKAIYAYGQIAEDQKGKDLKRNYITRGKEFSWGVKVNIQKRVKSEDGVSISQLRKLGIKQFEAPGGLIKITDEQFVILKEELNKTNNKDKSQRWIDWF